MKSLLDDSLRRLRCQQRLHFCAQAGIARALTFKEYGALGWFALKRRLQKLFDLLPAFGSHKSSDDDD